MPAIPLALPPQSNQAEHPHSGVAALINCYAVPAGDEQKTKMTIRAASGLDSLVTLAATGGIRGLLEVDGVAYAVAGRTVWQVDSAGGSVLKGGLPSDGYVGICRNQRGTGAQVTFSCDGLTYMTAGGSLAQITDPDLPPAVDCTTINRSTIFVSADGRMARSEIDDSSVIDGLDLEYAQASPDGLYRGVGRGGDLIAIGSKSTEVWRDEGAEAFGFSRGQVIHIGAIGPKSVTTGTVLGTTVADTVAWCATDNNGRFAGVVMLNGYTPQKISTPWIDRIVDREADKSAIVALSWVERGRGFLAWRLTSTTVVYDTSTGLWHERQSRDAYGNLTAWHIGYTAVLGGRVLAGHVSAPTLYWLDPDVYDDDGDEIIMRIRTPPASAFPGRMEIDRVALDVVPGVGLATGGTQDVNPVVTMRMSRDGETWGVARPVGLGAQGQRSKRVYWNRCGTHPQVTCEWTMSASVAREVLQATWEGATLPP